MTRVLLLVAFFAFGVVGCSRNATTSVRGKVTWNGDPIEKGYITFYPVESTDSTKGAEIVDGEYKVADLAPGRRRVFISVPPNVEVRDGNRLKLIPNRARITQQTPGNNQVVEVRPGSSEINVTLGKQ